ncbi:MAG TPA: ATP-binding protein [Ilumatobacter sp.]|nr:ATP-binding protein [Ilumatobacter sp.]
MSRQLSTPGFVNRTDELAALDAWWKRPGSALGIVWGRRRVGKSWLLKHWASDRRAVFHVASNQAPLDELASLSRAVAAVVSPRRRDLAIRPFVDWDDAFETLADLADAEPLLVVIDEFPELFKVIPGFDSRLRAIWERIDGTSQLKLVLCGSAVRSMEAIQAQDAPLFNRTTLRLLVQPFRPHEVSAILPAATPVERAAAWGVCGGMPYYLGAWDGSVGLRDNVERLFCHEHALLLNEGELVLANEEAVGGGRERLPEQVLRAIASGRSGFSDIKSVINTLPTRVLDHLAAVRLVDKVQPVTERPDNRRSYYRIADNFLAFWLTVIERHRPAIEQGLGPNVVGVVLEAFDDYMGARWEEALREHVRHLAAIGSLTDLVQVGEFWLRQVRPNEDPCQLDLVGLAGRRREVAVIGEAKWARRRSAHTLVGEMQRKAVEARLQLAAHPVWVACAREQLTNVPANCLAVTAADIFA